MFLKRTNQNRVFDRFKQAGNGPSRRRLELILMSEKYVFHYDFLSKRSQNIAYAGIRTH